MHCPSCGEGVGDKDQFCRQCGHRLVGRTLSPSAGPDGRTSTGPDRRGVRVGLVTAVYLFLAAASGTGVYALLARGPQGTITLGTPRLVVVKPASPEPVGDDAGPRRVAPKRRTPLRRPSRKRVAPKAPSPKPTPAAPSPAAPSRPSPARAQAPAPVKPAPKPAPRTAKPRATEPKAAEPKAAEPKAAVPKAPTKKDPREEAEDAIDRFRAGINADSVRMVVRHHLPQVRVCYDRALKQKPDLAGIVEVRFTISVKGRVTASSVHRNTSGHEGLGKCLAIVIKRWRFPKPVGGAVEFVYPFVFSAAE